VLSWRPRRLNRFSLARIQTKSALFSLAQATQGSLSGVGPGRQKRLTRPQLQIFRASVHTRVSPHFRTRLVLSDEPFSIAFPHPAE
jgi:hypothetical protein